MCTSVCLWRSEKHFLEPSHALHFVGGLVSRFFFCAASFFWWLMSFWKIICPCFPSARRSAGVTGANHCLQCLMWILRICTQVTRLVWQAFLSTESSLHPQPVSSLRMKRKGLFLRRSTQKYPSNPGCVDILLQPRGKLVGKLVIQLCTMHSTLI